MKKQNILSKIEAEQQKVIDNLRNSVHSYRTESDLDEDNTVDPEDYSRQSEAKDMQLRLEKLLSIAEQNLTSVAAAKEKTFDSAESGALVITDGQYFYIGISLPPFKDGGKEIYSFSEDAPVFKAIKDKKPGETFEFGGKTLTITEIL